MNTLSELLDTLRAKFPSLEIKYRYPSLYAVIVDRAFANIPFEERAGELFRRHQLPQQEINGVVEATGLNLVLCTAAERQADYSFLDAPGAVAHWAGVLADPMAVNPACPPPIRFIHFYGYKGGQARSSVLGLLARSLSDDGYRILVVDADIEAPSLHLLFGAPSLPTNATLLGCAMRQLSPSPQAVLFPATGSGRVDLIACRPSEAAYDLDAANFALHASLDPSIILNPISNIVTNTASYDLIVVDHRTGLNSTVLPMVASFPGPVIACMRLDDQSGQAGAFFTALFRQHPDNPGLIVSFSLNPKDAPSNIFDSERLPRIEAALQPLADALSTNTDNEMTVPEDLLDRWLTWFHDPAFFSSSLPEFNRLRPDNQEQIHIMRLRLDLPRIEGTQITLNASPPAEIRASDLSGNGNTDTGTLIQNEALRKLLPPTTPFTYILGRKGTGKTRLLRALAEQNLGEPLFVAEDFPHPIGIASGDPLVPDLVIAFRDDPARFWWAILDASLESTSREVQQVALKKILEAVTTRGMAALQISGVKERALAVPSRKVFLVDGVETAFQASLTRAFVEGLFRFLATVQNDSDLREKITLRLFLRTDLAAGARENVEQQMEHRVLHLAWNTQSILNFVLSRIAAREWFRDKFPAAIAAIDEQADQITQGALDEDSCIAILKLVFPPRVRRLNVLIHTFLTTYFSDGQGEKASFYPRVYDSFLRFIAEGGTSLGVPAMNQIENNHVAQDLIAEAHTFACRDYLDQVKAELNFLIEFSPNRDENAQMISNLLDSFSGRTTPFVFEGMLADVTSATSLPESDLRRAFQQMKRVGIFEDRPGYPEQWRAGRLFKSSLGMLYNRKRKGDDALDA
jgi:MinD-like ATPase involved in chromosome partitioning or flagellar assembly